MFRTSAILKNAREDKDLTVAEVSKKLKIATKYLEAIEDENRSCFPAEPYCSLIVKDYANFLGLNGEDVLSLFRRDFAMKPPGKPISAPSFSLTPQAIFKVGVIISLIIFTSYVVIEYLKYNQAPPLKVNWPEETTLAKSSKLEVSGVTDPEATVRVNDDLIIVDQFGNFKKVISLGDTDQKVTIESRSHSGKTAVQEKTFHIK